MSATLPLTPRQPSSLAGHVLTSWRSLRWSEAAVMGLVSLLFGAIDLVWLIEVPTHGHLPAVVATQFSASTLTALVFLLVWLPVARSDPTHPQRRARLIATMLLGSLAASLSVFRLMDLLPWPSVCGLLMQAEGKGESCHMVLWADIAGRTLSMFLPALLITGALETRLQRERQEESAHALLLEHSQLRQRELAARLATLQAQVEPALLFQALVGIQQAYAEHRPEAGARIERLIRHLRLALPRLSVREQPLAVEVELIQSYLDVLQDLGTHHVSFEAATATLALPPMLLLPLVQRALRLGAPQRCWLRVQGRRLTLGFDQPGLCSEDADLKALHERLAVLEVGLVCTSSHSATEFQLQLR